MLPLRRDTRQRRQRESTGGDAGDNGKTAAETAEGDGWTTDNRRNPVGDRTGDKRRQSRRSRRPRRRYAEVSPGRSVMCCHGRPDGYARSGKGRGDLGDGDVQP